MDCDCMDVMLPSARVSCDRCATHRNYGGREYYDDDIRIVNVLTRFWSLSALERTFVR